MLQVNDPEACSTAHMSTTNSNHGGLILAAVTASEASWERALDSLRGEDPKLVDHYERLLHLEQTSLQETPSTSSTNIEKLTALVAKKVEEAESDQWKLNVGNKAIAIRDQLDKVAKIIVAAKDVMVTGLAFEPHAAAAWAGVSLLLPFLLNPSSQREAVSEGLREIPLIMQRWRVIEKIHQEHHREELVGAADLETSFNNQLVKLYTRIFEYQARAVCQFARNTLKQYLREVVKADKWTQLYNTIKSLDEACSRSIALLDAKRVERALGANSERLEELFTSWDKERKIWKEIDKTGVETLDAVRSVAKEQQTYQMTQAESQCLQAFGKFSYADQKRTNPQRVSGTCNWLLEHERFLEWRDNPDSGILWVSTGPGCGKSVLCKALVDECLFSSGPDPIATSYFFFKDISSEQRSVKVALSSLLHQLLSQRGEFIHYALDGFRKHGAQICNELELMWDILIKIGADRTSGKIICLLDALDESDKVELKFLISRLEKLYSHGSASGSAIRNLKFFVTSRPYHEIEDHFQHLVRDFPRIHISGDEETNAIKEEISTVIKVRVREIGLPSILCEHLQNRLLSIEHRTYLWLHLILDDIKRTIRTVPGSKTTKKLEQYLEKIPENVYEAYDTILERSSDKALTVKALHLVIGAIRPLTLKEMSMALLVDENTMTESEIQCDDEKEFESVFKNLCGLFVSVVDSKIYLIHQTAKDYLVANEAQGTSNNYWRHSLASNTTQQVLARSCMLYLLLPGVRDYPIVVTSAQSAQTTPEWAAAPPSSRPQLYLSWPPRITSFAQLQKEKENQGDFAEYAAMSWTQHLNRLVLSKDIMNLASRCCILCARHIGPGKVLSSLNARHNVQLSDVEDMEEDWQAGGERSNQAIRAAVILKLDKLLLAILNQVPRSANKSRNTVSLFNLTLKAPYQKTMRTVMNQINDINATDWVGRPALSIAAAFSPWSYPSQSEFPHSQDRHTRHQSTYFASTLLGRGADVNQDGGRYGFPLQYAVVYGDYSMVKLLLDHGATVNKHGGLYGSALAAAVDGLREDIVELLLEAGADVNYSAARSGSRDGGSGRFGKDKDGDGNADDAGSPSALYMAITHPSGVTRAMLQLLLAHGADVKQEGPGFGSPLQAAVATEPSYGTSEPICTKTEVVKILLDHGADVNQVGGKYGSALQAACALKEPEIVLTLLDYGASETLRGDGLPCAHEIALRLWPVRALLSLSLLE